MTKEEPVVMQTGQVPTPCNVIDGSRQPARGSDLVHKVSPRDGATLYEFVSSDTAEVERAVQSARTAFDDGRWSKLPVQTRKDVLFRLAALIDAHAKELATLECLDVGKPIAEAQRFDVPAAAATFRFNAEAADKVSGKVYAVDERSLSYELLQPIGVVVGLVGWNFPLLLAAGKLAPALATGNSIVLKPSELTSASACRLAELALEAGVPGGVFNVVCGLPSTGHALARHSAVDLLTFTGSTATGKRLLSASAESNMKRLILECGGKAPNIVFADSPDLAAVADRVLTAAFYNQGSVCTASSRLLIQESIKEEFLSVLISKTGSLIPGDPLRNDTKLGALVSRAHQERVLEYIREGTREGASSIFESRAPPPFAGGFYLGPTILDGVCRGHKVAQEEIFGPVLSVLTFRDEAEAICIANDTIYGLSAIVWTKDMARAHRASQGLRAGWVVVNATGSPRGGPGTGVLSFSGHKQSGVGTEGGLYGLQEFMTRTTVQMFS